MDLLIIKDRRIDYDGSAIRSHWAYRNFGILGDSLVVFRGRCDVKVEEMVDIEDLRLKKEIKGDDMIHYIAEIFWHPDVLLASSLQKLFIARLVEILRDLGVDAEREGDDIYVEGRKLSISIATVSPVSLKIHIGINVSTSGVPREVNAIGLDELGVDALEFMERSGRELVEEYEKVRKDSMKVRWVT
ncbi:DUF366 family protein [Pyrococcus abyssi]|uniref:DUF366 domain-containing protein n=1 Tax=Pyrococcus abyssi (strain GE5 / Orsay) TaxID=272844 RepID=G8ZG38_PYRAB|nr:DUF366 family protein [Pyrococcus abyssi]CCE69579.1 TPA: hypothetical protein PAB0138 [Pyrococcus abyssi GE5]